MLKSMEVLCEGAVSVASMEELREVSFLLNLPPNLRKPLLIVLILLPNVIYRERGEGGGRKGLFTVGIKDIKD